MRLWAGIALLAILAPSDLAAQAADLTQKSLEDLMNIEVTSVSKKEQKTSQAAAAVFVISPDDILRSGAFNIPDLLRMVPGLDVAQIDGGKWAISARGFNGQYSNKLLVLIDGRTVYNPEFAGVLWDSQNVPLESIERIEVVRGPGAAVWGSNAVNGVINIITKSADSTQGGYAAGRGGSDLVDPETIRYGGKARGLGAYRVYVDGFHRNALPRPTNLEGHDDWSLIHGGYRIDAKLSEKDSLTAEGEVYQGDAGELVATIVSIYPPTNTTLPMRDYYWGWDQLVRWNRSISPRSATSLQVYFDRTTRGDLTYGLGLNTFDIDFQHHFALKQRQDIVWGVGYRISADGVNPTLRIIVTPLNRRIQLFSSFAQDEIALLPDCLHLSLGARFEHNGFSGFNFQPSVRLTWTPGSRNMLWSAVSGADRTPTRSDTDIRINSSAYPGPGGITVLASLFGNPHEKNEHLTAFEAGYRNTWTKQFSVDLSAFYNRYHDLESVERGQMSMETDPSPPHLLIPATDGNGLYGETHGVEVFANLKAASFWTLSPGYAYMAMHLHKQAGSQDTYSIAERQGGTPDHQAQLRSSMSLPWKLQWNVSAFFVNRLKDQSIPSYTRLDSNLIWRAGDHASITVAGQNLIKEFHPEYNGPDTSVQFGRMRRDAYVKISWAF